MKRRLLRQGKSIVALFMIFMIFIIPARVSGEVKPIEDTEDKLADITEEEKSVLNELFIITQRIEGLEQEEILLNQEMDKLQGQMEEIGAKIDKKQQAYDEKLGILEEVLGIYQRGGPASYLEILLSADSLSSFLKSINVVKDISRNVGELLDTLKQEKLLLEEEKIQQEEKGKQLENTKAELLNNLETSKQLKLQREEYLLSLQDQRVHYEEYLSVLKAMWGDCTELFSEVVAEIGRVVEEGYLTYENLHMEPGLVTMKGAILEEEFNRILKENSELPEDLFQFEAGEVILTVPEMQLILHGNFFLASESAIQYEVTSGTFYGMPLDEVSMTELFQNGPLLLDFDIIAGDTILLDYSIKKVESQKERLAFEIKMIW